MILNEKRFKYKGLDLIELYDFDDECVSIWGSLKFLNKMNLKILEFWNEYLGL